ncbi:carbohydrate kinase family protein [Mesorhizobium sp. BAC0120]|uniref:carbohydrate kinase family protein n=1 Tax=Mesorhizobium sp. BAC0120 TaxID=3090670 RepID=UPI00298D1EC4|nr:carbohydrate kinase family protein [Mesorhizobium sp. BAC0120]MDW6026587.1 carbohydrate kinase family protein [Mesorhizobium sp. BAC0120]
MTRLKLLAVGGAHVDRRGQVSGIFVPGASNPGRMSEDVGGGVFNALRNAVQRGVEASLISLRGADSAGENVARAIDQAKIRDLSAVFLDRATPSYTALIDRDGEVIAGLADMELYEFAFPKQLRRSKVRDEVAAADAILTDANLPAEALGRLAALAAGKPLFAIAISPAKVVRLWGALDTVACLFMNTREAASLAATPHEAEPAALAERLAGMGLGSGVITSGSSAVIGFDTTGIFQIVPPRLASMADATGAGDALAGVTVAAMIQGKPLREALREGIAAAVLTIGSPLAVARISDAALEEVLALVPEATTVA